MLGVIGGGAMGAALAIHLARLGREVVILATEFDRGPMEAVERGEPHPALGVPVPGVTWTTEWDGHLPQLEVAFVAVATAGLVPVSREVAEGASAGCLFAVATKGWDAATLRSAASVVADEVGDPGRVVALVGPSLAIEIARGVPTGLVCASTSAEAARKVAAAVAGDGLRAFTSDDPVGVEAAAVCKNVVAIAIGMCEGLAPSFGVDAMTNAQAFIFARGLIEMARLSEALGGRADTTLGLTGAGDLYVTALGGRNARFGRLVGSGKTPEQALEEMATTVEGYANAQATVSLARKFGISLPVMEAVAQVLDGEVPAEQALRSLMRGPVEAER